REPRSRPRARELGTGIPEQDPRGLRLLYAAPTSREILLGWFHLNDAVLACVAQRDRLREDAHMTWISRMVSVGVVRFMPNMMALVLVILTMAAAQAATAQSAFETPPVLKASEFAPPAMLEG